MNRPLPDWIVTRRAELARELAALDAAEAAYRAAGRGKVIDTASVSQESVGVDRNDGLQAKTTIKQDVVKLLGESPDLGLTALEILQRLQERGRIDLVRTSLSPQLSRLKQDGKIVSDGRRWLIAE